jgi:RNA polymerase sigma-70 factor (ECF subfamily)
MDQSMAIPREHPDAFAADETALVQAARNDPAAFAPLYSQYRDRVYAYLRTRTRSPEDAADLTQQVFLQALDALPRYRPGRAPFTAWLFRIAHNAAANAHRRRRDQVPWDLLPPALQPRAESDLDGHVIRQENLVVLEALLRSCSPAGREMLALHFAADLTIAETARVVGKSEAAVKKQISRTIRALKEQYHDRS